MRINNILEGINKAIDHIRESSNVEAKGHFTAITTIKKSMGPYKECRIEINYTDLLEHKTTLFCNTTCMERCAPNEEYKLIDRTTENIITKFFVKWLECGDDVIKKGYGDK